MLLKVAAKDVMGEGLRRRVAQYCAEIFHRDGLGEALVARLNVEKAMPSFHEEALARVGG